jgi:hypothetical protein
MAQATEFFQLYATPASERDVVLHVVELAGGLLRAGSRGLGRRFAARRAIILARRAGSGARAEHLHAIGADLRAVPILARLLVLVLARAQLAFDIDLRALLQILARDLGELAEKADAVPFGGFLLFAAGLVLPGLGSRDADVGDRFARGR